ncbi:MAG: DUF58 domain-containing protein [Oscillospiraceae bacterium]|nr:DUF58 domain-containing protein [Oscillospiraceae bacterium]
MTRNRVLYVLFLLGCLVFSAAYRSRISAVLLVAAAAYPLLALVAALISVHTVRVGFGLTRSVHEKNEQFELPVYVRNNFIFPFAPAELTCFIPDNDTGLFLKKQVFVSVSPLKKMRIFIPCMHRYRGDYPAQITRVTVYDPLKIIRVSRRANSQMQLVILPRRIQLSRLSALFGGDRGAVPEHVKGGDKEDFSHVRDYRMGDILQMIHWKLTAKQQELMIKEYESDGDRRGTVLFGFGDDEAAPYTLLRRSDAVIEAVVAVVMAAMRAGVKVVADMGCELFGAVSVADKADFERFFDMMSVLPPDAHGRELGELIADRVQCDGSAMFIVTPLMTAEITAAADAAAELSRGIVALIYVNCTGKPMQTDMGEERRFLFAELVMPDVSSDSDSAFSDMQEQLLCELTEPQ